MARPLRVSALLGVLVAVVVLLLAAPSPDEALRHLRGPADAADPTAPLVAAVALLAWLLAAWLALTLALTLLARVPGRLGGAAAATARRVAPAALRRIVAGALGLSVVASTLAGTSAAATAQAPAPPPAAAPASLDWPGSPSAPDLDWPAAAPSTDVVEPPPVLASPVRTGPDAGAVVVEPGDTLWGLAARALEQQQGAPPDDVQVAAAWPAWWSANREVVGDDPDLLRPGTSLQPPPVDAAGDPPG